MRIQLWSSNYDPEPTGIAPLSRAWALAMRDRGHQVEVVAAHPHYPEPRWGTSFRPYRETRDGIRVVRIPIWPGRDNLRERLRQDATFVAALMAVAPFLGTPDAIVAVSPSFPALLPTRIAARLRRVPWILWLQDILPDGAAVTGLLNENRATVKMARRFERSSYHSAARVVAISETFRSNLSAKGVPTSHVVRIYNPASRPVRANARPLEQVDHTLALNMGNIGRSQNLDAVVRAFEGSEGLARMNAQFVMAGDGVAGGEVRAAITTSRVRVTGLLAPEELDPLIERAAVGVVTQRPRDHDFNVPSKLMNFMGAGVPVVASVDANSEVARVVTESRGGWVTDSARLEEEFVPTLAAALANPQERAWRGEAALRFAQAHFAPAHTAEQFEQVLLRAAR